MLPVVLNVKQLADGGAYLGPDPGAGCRSTVPVQHLEESPSEAAGSLVPEPRSAAIGASWSIAPDCLEQTMYLGAADAPTSSRTADHLSSPRKQMCTSMASRNTFSKLDPEAHLVGRSFDGVPPEQVTRAWPLDASVAEGSRCTDGG